MTDTATDPLPPLKTTERHIRLATDTFCVECGYNLHSQEVTRDERLGIFVCRCPECGRYHPAGTGVTATKPWLSRLAAALLAFWVLIVLFAIFWIVMGMGAVQVGYVETFTYRRQETTDGRTVEWAQLPNGAGWGAVLAGTTQPAPQYRQLRVLHRQNQNDWRPGKWDFLPFPIGAAALGFVTGMLMVVFLWHWKRRRYILAMFLPFAVAGVVSVIFSQDDEYERIYRWVYEVVFGYAALEFSFMGLGILLGRPIARGVLRMFIPPKPRQHFAFLWGIDNKKMTPATP
jgi:hypothetical protein